MFVFLLTNQISAYRETSEICKEVSNHTKNNLTLEKIAKNIAEFLIVLKTSWEMGGNEFSHHAASDLISDLLNKHSMGSGSQ